MREWISVEERLPEDERPVIICCADSELIMTVRCRSIDYYDIKDKKWHNATIWKMIGLTH